MRIIDISVTLSSSTPSWPQTPGIRLRHFKRLEAGDSCNNTVLECDAHVGTHVDAPVHFFEDGTTVDQLPLDILVGPAVVAYLPRQQLIDAKHLSRLALLPGTQRLLLRTRNSALWARGETKFQEDYVGLTPDAAHWVVDQGIRLIGVDYLSVERYGHEPIVHRVLLGSGVVVVEGLNLHNVKPGSYEFICLPVRLGGADGAPARAILRSD